MSLKKYMFTLYGRLTTILQNALKQPLSAVVFSRNMLFMIL